MTEGRGRGTSPATNTELRDVSNGSATGNHVFDNCTGILLLANAPGPVTNWTVRHNLVRRNNKADCGEGGTSGTGTGNRFVDNRCRTSQPDGLCD
jgi:hypothetical protein